MLAAVHGVEEVDEADGTQRADIVSFELNETTTQRAPSSFSSTSIARKSAIRSAPPNSPAIRSWPVKNETSPHASVASKSKAQSTIDVSADVAPASEGGERLRAQV